MAGDDDLAALEQGVREAADGTPYVVTTTADGFTVQLDVADASWWGLFDGAGLARVHRHHVRVPRPGRYSITDDVRTVEWEAGTPRVAVEAQRIQGRVVEFGSTNVWALDARGRLQPQAAFRFDTREGRDLVDGVARHLGLSYRRGAAELIGLWAAGIALVGAVVSAVVVVALLLTGALP